MPNVPDSIFSNMRIWCSVLSRVVLNWIVLHFKLLVRKKKNQFEDVTLGSGKLQNAFLHNFVVFYEQNQQKKLTENDGKCLLML